MTTPSLAFKDIRAVLGVVNAHLTSNSDTLSLRNYVCVEGATDNDIALLEAAGYRVKTRESKIRNVRGDVIKVTRSVWVVR